MAKPEVVVIGGGVTGCAAAYFLSKAGASVQVIEKNAIGSEASGMAPAVLAPLMDMEAPGEMDVRKRWPYVEFNLEGFRLLSRLHGELGEEAGIDVQYRTTHILHTAWDEADETRLKGQIERQQLSGIKMEWLDYELLRQLYPGLGPRVRGALCWYDQAEIEGYRLTLAYMQAAEKRGAVMSHGLVKGIKRRGRRVISVVTETREIPGDFFVLATGPWASRGGRWFGRRIPVIPVRGQIVVMEPAGAIPPYLIFHGLNYIVPKKSGLIMAGTTLERVGFRNRVTRAGRDFIIKGALRMSNGIGGTKVVRMVSGLRPNSLDTLPILGRLSGWENAYVAAGNGPQGIILSGVTGRSIAELIIKGKTRADITTFDPARFVAE